MQTYTSHGKTIEIRTRLFGMFLWTVCGFEVRIGDRVFLPKMDRIALRTFTEFNLDADGQQITGVVRSLATVWLLPRVRYSVTIGDTEVAQGRQTLSRWFLMYFGWILVGLFVLLMLMGCVLFISVVKRVVYGA